MKLRGLLGFRFLLISTVIVLLNMTSVICKAHREPVHAEIARGAALSSDGLSNFAKETIGNLTNRVYFKPFEIPVTQPQPPIFWITNGAFQQDYWPRWGNHFYTVKSNRVPGAVKGLTDSSETGVLLPLPKKTTNSFAWATVTNQPTPETGFKSKDPFKLFRNDPPPSTNDNRWWIARESEYAGLTNTWKTIRDEKLARMFYSLGHIIHLNQDASQPDHTRDDAHPFRANIEDYGEKTHLPRPEAFNPVPRGWAYWRDQAHFTKLLDFWDRGRYQGDAAALDADATGDPASKLGLAEFSNGNLLGENALYAEFFKTNDTQCFPHPSLKDTDQPQLKPANWQNFLDSTTLADGTQGQRPYLRKIGAGTNVAHHSALKYLGAMNMGKMGTLPGPTAVSIADTNVLRDYHDIMIPKAIEYSGGILDYFFRGSLTVSVVGYDTNTLTYTNQIMNTSGEAFGPGFYAIYEDDPTSGDRTQIAQTNLSTALQSSNSFLMTFPAPDSFTNKLLLIYRGTIGLDGGGAALDPVDANIAIAAKSFYPGVGNTLITNFALELATNGFPPGYTFTSYLESDEFPFDLTPGNFEVRVNSAFFDDAGAIGSINSTGPSISCPGNPQGNEITDKIIPEADVTITPDSRHLRVTIAATDDADCAGYIGWYNVSITWRAQPAAGP